MSTLKIRILLWSVLVLITGWLLYQAVAPGGRITYVYDFSKPNFFIGKLTPADRVKPVANGSQAIIGDPVYFSLQTVRQFNKAKLTLTYKVNGADQCAAPRCAPIIEAGVLADKLIWRYDLKPMENVIIDQLAMAWSTIKGETGETLLEREKKYSSVEEFLAKLPPPNEIALYNYDLYPAYTLSDYKPSVEDNVIKYSLRGSFQLYTYIKNEELNFKFIFYDINKNSDPDEVVARLLSNNQLIDAKFLADDGNAADNGRASQERGLELILDNLPEGAYKIEIRANDDIITKKIATRQKKLSFINKMWLANGNSKNIQLFSDSQYLSAKTVNPANLQKIKFGEADLDLVKTYKQFTVNSASSTNKILLAKDDVILAGDGVFSFSQDSLINPAIRNVSNSVNINVMGINYILAKYQPLKQQGEWTVSQAEFDLSKAYSEKGKYSFLISLPGLKPDDEINDSVEISEIKIDLAGKSFWEKVRQAISNKQ